jgi:hypothetical protein
MTNEFEIEGGLDPLDGTDGNEDPDQDNLTNTQEFEQPINTDGHAHRRVDNSTTTARWTTRTTAAGGQRQPGQRADGANDGGDACDTDDDNDGDLDAADNCPLVSNANQANTDRDAQGDACDSDDDNDTVADGADNCPLNANQNQLNTDGDAQGDVCDADDDNDGRADGRTTARW